MVKLTERSHRLPAYLLTRSIGIGLFFYAAIFQFVLDDFFKPSYGVWLLSGTLLALLFGAAAAGLKRADLLLREAVLRSAFLVITGFWLVLEIATYWRWMHYTWVFSLRGTLIAVALPLAMYFTASSAAIRRPRNQGRWRYKPMFAARLLVLSMTAGTAALLLLLKVKDIPSAEFFHLPLCLVGFLLFHALCIALTLWNLSRGSDAGPSAAKALLRGAHSRTFWQLGLLVGHALPIALILTGLAALVAPAAAICLIGLYGHEAAYVWATKLGFNSVGDSDEDFP